MHVSTSTPRTSWCAPPRPVHAPSRVSPASLAPEARRGARASGVPSVVVGASRRAGLGLVAAVAGGVARFGVVVALACVLGCGGSGHGASSPNRPLPTYAGHATELFDDTIEPAAVGLDLDKSYQPKADPLLRERAQTCDAVLRVRVATVTAKVDGPETTYQIGLHTVEKVTGENPPSTDFNVPLTKASESYGILKSFESRLVGSPFIAFVREFVRPDGDREVHFHFAPDTKQVKSAVSDALVLGEMAK